MSLANTLAFARIRLHARVCVRTHTHSDACTHTCAHSDIRCACMRMGEFLMGAVIAFTHEFVRPRTAP